MNLSEQTARRAEALGPAIRGMLWMTLCGLCFAGLNATTRVITADLHSWQTVCLRYAFGALVMLPLIVRTRLSVLRSNNVRLQVIRCGVHSLGTGMWFLALPMVPLAEITAISFTSPIFLAIGGILFFGEAVRRERWVAIGVGFVGVLIVLYPKLEHGIAANWASLLLIAAAPVSASSYLLAKRLMRYDKTETIVLWQAMLVSLFTLPIALVYWRPMTLTLVAMFVFVGLFGSLGHYALNRSLKATDIGATQPARFLELVWASALGFLIWGDVPPVWTFAGAMVIFSATTWIARREAIAARAAR
jgi:drug/metabolite transporter (DMT)-like permease